MKNYLQNGHIVRVTTPAGGIASGDALNRRRRWGSSGVHQEIFDEIVLQALKAGLVDGHVIYTDSTLLKASANRQKFDIELVKKERAAYWEELDRAIDQDRAAQGKKPLPAREPQAKEPRISRTDPDAGYIAREDKPRGFYYLDHRSVVARHTIITDTYVTAATVHDSIPYLERLDRQRERFGLNVCAVGLDAGYATTPIAKGLEERNITGVTPYVAPSTRKGYFRRKEFEYDGARDVYRCPNGKALKHARTDKDGYRHYKTRVRDCAACPLRENCIPGSGKIKSVTRHIWHESRERMDSHRFTPWGKALYKRRKETVERSFADAKQLHGHRYARLQGIGKVREQCLLAAACQNMKKIALVLARMAARIVCNLGLAPQPA